MTDERTGRRYSDPSLTKIARDIGKLAKEQQRQASAFESHQRDYAEHVKVDRERNGRIGKVESAVEGLQALTFQRLVAIEHGADLRTERLQEIGDVVVRIESYAKGRADLVRQITQALPTLLKAIGAGAGAGAVLTAAGPVLSRLGALFGAGG